MFAVRMNVNENIIHVRCNISFMQFLHIFHLNMPFKNNQTWFLNHPPLVEYGKILERSVGPSRFYGSYQKVN